MVRRYIPQGRRCGSDAPAVAFELGERLAEAGAKLGDKGRAADGESVADAECASARCITTVGECGADGGCDVDEGCVTDRGCGTGEVGSAITGVKDGVESGFDPGGFFGQGEGFAEKQAGA